MRTRARAPSYWADTQNNLGATLTELGKRGDSQALRDAITALHAALEVHTRADDPADWAEAQTNLGEALETQGDQGAGRAAYDAAIACYRAALEAYTLERSAADHASVTLSLARAEQKLAKAR